MEEKKKYSIIDFEKDFQKGTGRAFKELFELFYFKLHFFTFGITKNREESEDIVMKAFQSIFLIHETFDKLPVINSFLYTCCKNGSLDYVKKVKRNDKRNNALNYHINYVEIAEIEFEISKILLTTLRQEINKLPRQTQLLLKMLYFENVLVKDISKKLNISMDSVRSIKRYGINKLRGVIHKNDFVKDDINDRSIYGKY